MATYQPGSSVWVNTWKNRMEKDGAVPVETRFDFTELNNVDPSDKGTFEAKVMLFMTVQSGDLYSSPGERKHEPGETFAHIINKDGVKVQEWTPWIEIGGKLSHKWQWVQEDKDNGTLTYVYEMLGEFSMGRNETSRFYPFDFHELGVSSSTNRDSTHLCFIPKGMRDGGMQPQVTLSSKVSRVRSDNLDGTLRGRWTYSDVPRVSFKFSKGFGANPKKYSEVTGAIFVSRHWLINLIYEMLRPLSLGLLSAFSQTIFEADGTPAGASEVLTFNVSILVAMSLAFVHLKTERVTLTDLYSLSIFVFVCLSVVILYFNRGSGQISNGDASGVLWGVFGIIHALFASYLVFYIQPQKLALMRKHGVSIANSCFGTSSRSSPNEARVMVAMTPKTRSGEEP